MSTTLLLSLQQDIIYLENLITTIDQFSTDFFDISSWKCPTKSFRQTLTFAKDYVHDESYDYPQYLEILIDRVYVVLNFYLRFLEKRLDDEVKVSRPKRLTLGAVASTIWRGIVHLQSADNKQKLEENANSNLKKFEKSRIFDRSSQTVEATLAQCDSCHIAVKSIRAISEKMKSIVNRSFTEKIEKHIQSQWYDLTQFGCMNSIINAIVADLSKLSQTNEKVQRDLCASVTVHAQVTQQLQAARTVIDRLTNSCRELEATNENFSEQSSDLQTQLTHVERQNKNLLDKLAAKSKQCNIAENSLVVVQVEYESYKCRHSTILAKLSDMEDRNKCLTAQCEAQSQKIDSLEQDNNELRLENNRVKQDLQALNVVADNLEQNFKDLKMKVLKNEECLERKTNRFEISLHKLQQLMETKITSQDNIINNLKAENQKLLDKQCKAKPIREEFDMFQEKVNTIDQNFMSLRSLMRSNEISLNDKTKNYETSLSNIQNLVDTKVIVQDQLIEKLTAEKEQLYDLKIAKNIPVATSAGVLGNPIDDMTKQIEHNQKNIRDMENQNTALRLTIDKLQQINALKSRPLKR